jgi:hypothetical protein
MDGKPKKQRPSDKGGIGQGSPSSGKGTSQSKKSASPVDYRLNPKKFPDGITPANFEIIKRTLQSSVDFDWTKKKTVEELRKSASMTVRDARELVKQELQDTKQWENEDF